MKIQAGVRRELELVLLDLKRAHDYMSKPETVVCHKGGRPTTTLHMERKLDGAVFYEINKEIGSNLTGLEMGIRKCSSAISFDLKPMRCASNRNRYAVTVRLRCAGEPALMDRRL